MKPTFGIGTRSVYRARRRAVVGAALAGLMALTCVSFGSQASAAPAKLYDVIVKFYTIQISNIDDSGDCCRDDELELYGALGAYQTYWSDDNFHYLTTEFWSGQVGTANSKTGYCGGSWSVCNRHFRAGTYDVSTLGAGCNYLFQCDAPYSGGLGGGYWKDHASGGGKPYKLVIPELMDGQQFHVTSEFYDYDYDWYNANDTLANNHVVRTFHPGSTQYAYMESTSSHAKIRVTYSVSSVCSWNC
jgi:hypothetical protein